jgi:hypothetical protein
MLLVRTLANTAPTQESTLKRHYYYCRSRKSGSTSRVRSCVFCARGKAKCDSKRPHCSRCKSKGIECQYAENSRLEPAPRAHGKRSSDERPRAEPSSMVGDFVGTRFPPNQDDATMLNSILSMPLENFGVDSTSWDAAEFDFTDFLEPHSLTDNVDCTSPEASLTRHSIFTGQHKHPAEPPMLLPDTALPPMLSTYSPRSLVLRQAILDKAARSVQLTLGTLKSYPRGIVHDNTLPPFIHPLLVPHGKENDQMEPLNNCMSLLHLVSSGIGGSKKLFWRNVRTECEHMRAEVRASSLVSIRRYKRIDKSGSVRDSQSGVYWLRCKPSLYTPLVDCVRVKRNTTISTYSY